MSLLRHYRQWKSHRRYQKAIDTITRWQSSGDIDPAKLQAFAEGSIRILEWARQDEENEN